MKKRLFFAFVVGVLGFINAAPKGYASTHSVSLNKKVKVVNLATVQKAVKNKNYTIVDARDNNYLMVGGPMIPGAINVPHNAEQQKIEELLPNKAAKIIVYCGGLQCPASTKLANRLISWGYRNVYEFPGGIRAWQKAGLKTDLKKSS